MNFEMTQENLTISRNVGLVCTRQTGGCDMSRYTRLLKNFGCRLLSDRSGGTHSPAFFAITLALTFMILAALLATVGF